MKSLLTRIINRVVNLFKKDSIIYVSDIFKEASKLIGESAYLGDPKCTPFMCNAINTVTRKSPINGCIISSDFQIYGFTRDKYNEFIKENYPYLQLFLTEDGCNVWIDIIDEEVLKSKREFLLELVNKNKNIKLKIPNNE